MSTEKALFNKYPRLTVREVTIVALIAEGQDNYSIAESLGIAVKTVKNVLLRVPEKMNVDPGGSSRVRIARAAWYATHNIPLED